MALWAGGPSYPRSYLVTGRASPGQAMTATLGKTGRQPVSPSGAQRLTSQASGELSADPAWGPRE